MEKMKKQKTRVEDIDRERFDFRDADQSRYKTGKGLTADIVAEISKMKNEPDWMLEHRLRSLEICLCPPGGLRSMNSIWTKSSPT